MQTTMTRTMFCTKGQFIVKRGQKGFNGAQSKEEGKYQESIQSSSTPDPGHRMGK